MRARTWNVMRGPNRTTFRRSASFRVGAVALAGVFLCCCGTSSVAITAVATKTSPTPTPTPTPSASPTSSVPITQLLTRCPKQRSFSSLPVFAQVNNAGSIGVAADGSVWITTGMQGQVVHVSSTGAPMASYAEPTPEGVVALSNGNVLIAEQGQDLIVELNPSTLGVSTFLQLTPVPGRTGVAGLGVDTANQLLLVPDSAQGNLLTVPLAGGAASILATGLRTPVDAAVGPNGVIEVADADSTGLFGVPPGGGNARKYVGLSELSAVAVKDLLIYVTAPLSHDLIAFNPATQHRFALVTGIGNPDGVAVLSNGQLLISDASTGTLAIASSC